jgi:hypothetical protein
MGNGSGPLQAGFEYRPKRYETGQFSTSSSGNGTLSHVRRGLGKKGRFCLGRTHLQSQQSLAKVRGWVSQPCRATCLSKGAVQREFSPPIPDLRVAADCGLSSGCAYASWGRGFHDSRRSASLGRGCTRCPSTASHLPSPLTEQRARRPSQSRAEGRHTDCRTAWGRRIRAPQGAMTAHGTSWQSRLATTSHARWREFDQICRGFADRLQLAIPGVLDRPPVMPWSLP